MISEQNKELLKKLWINYGRNGEAPDNFIGTCYAYELSELLDKVREEG